MSVIILRPYMYSVHTLLLFVKIMDIQQTLFKKIIVQFFKINLLQGRTSRVSPNKGKIQEKRTSPDKVLLILLKC
jgi:hypothetical protein